MNINVDDVYFWLSWESQRGNRRASFGRHVEEISYGTYWCRAKWSFTQAFRQGILQASTRNGRCDIYDAMYIALW